MARSKALAGRHALVTGASGGLGAHFALLLARAGATVAVAARRMPECARVAGEIVQQGWRATPVPIDVSDAASVKQAVDFTIGAFGSIDILVNNAGVADTRAWLDTREEDFDRVMDTNLRGAYLVSREVASRMKASGGGTIVNIASILGLAVSGNVGAYAVSKAGLVQMTKSMALEFARHGIRVNALCPGYIETDINRAFFATEAGKALIKRIPQRRLGQMGDLDGALLLLASEAGAYITGTTLSVDGGHLLSPL